MKFFTMLFMFFVSMSAFAVTANDVAAANANLANACSNGQSSACGRAYAQQQATLNQLHQEQADSMNRGEYGDQRRMRVQEEERWRRSTQ